MSLIASRRSRGLALVVGLGLLLTACSDPTDEDDSPKAAGTVTVGSAAFPESEIIAEIYAQALEGKGVKVQRKMQIGAREAYVPALQDGSIDLIPEYTGNLLSYFDKKATATSSEAVEEALDDALPNGLEILDPAPAEDKDSLNVTREVSESKGITSIPDLQKIKGLRLAANPEFKERSYGIPGLEKVYGLTDITFVPISDSGGPATLKALLDGDADVADIYSTTPSIKENQLVTLADPKNLIAAQNVVPLLRDKAATDVVEDTLDAVSAQLTTDDLIDLNAQNQGSAKVAPKDLAKKWLAAKNLG